MKVTNSLRAPYNIHFTTLAYMAENIYSRCPITTVKKSKITKGGSMSISDGVNVNYLVSILPISSLTSVPV